MFHVHYNMLFSFPGTYTSWSLVIITARHYTALFSIAASPQTTSHSHFILTRSSTCACMPLSRSMSTVRVISMILEKMAKTSCNLFHPQSPATPAASVAAEAIIITAPTSPFTHWPWIQVVVRVVNPKAGCHPLIHILTCTASVLRCQATGSPLTLTTSMNLPLTWNPVTGKVSHPRTGLQKMSGTGSFRGPVIDPLTWKKCSHLPTPTWQDNSCVAWVGMTLSTSIPNTVGTFLKHCNNWVISFENFVSFCYFFLLLKFSCTSRRADVSSTFAVMFVEFMCWHAVCQNSVPGSSESNMMQNQLQIMSNQASTTVSSNGPGGNGGLGSNGSTITLLSHGNNGSEVSYFTSLPSFDLLRSSCLDLDCQGSSPSSNGKKVMWKKYIFFKK